jgi:acyl-CoA dehydrogenase
VERANMAFGLCPLLTLGAIEALDAHGSDELKKIYLPKLVSGEWTGTMNLTEPQAGSDVGALRTRAERPRRQLSHHRPEDLHHLWRPRHDRQHRASRAGAPAGCAGRHQGISLFLVPKFLVNADGSLGRATTCAASGSSTSSASTPPDLHHDLWRHGGAIGYLIGEENRGMPACSR